MLTSPRLPLGGPTLELQSVSDSRFTVVAFFGSWGDSTGSYVRPASLTDVLSAIAACEQTIIAGGTDVYPAHVGKPLPARIVDVSRVAEMRTIVARDGAWRIGGAVTWAEIAARNLPPAFRALQQAARQVGSTQVQNRATVAGNLCNASPAADGVPPLLTLEAEVELSSLAGVRTLPLESFIVGYRRTALRANEIVSAVIVPDPAPAARSAFVKLGARKYLVISIVMAAALIEKRTDGAIARALVAVGSASEKACRLGELERDLVGLTPGVAPSSRLRAEHFDELSPIDDVRATAAYRCKAALGIVGEALDRAAAAESL